MCCRKFSSIFPQVLVVTSSPGASLVRQAPAISSRRSQGWQADHCVRKKLISPTVWINVPICLIALGLVLFALRNFHFQQRCHQASWVAAYRKLRDSFDFLGLVLLMGATSCLLLGFSRSSSSGCTYQSLPRPTHRRSRPHSRIPADARARPPPLLRERSHDLSAHWRRRAASHPRPGV